MKENSTKEGVMLLKKMNGGVINGIHLIIDRILILMKHFQSNLMN